MIFIDYFLSIFALLDFVNMAKNMIQIKAMELGDDLLLD